MDHHCKIMCKLKKLYKKLEEEYLTLVENRLYKFLEYISFYYLILNVFIKDGKEIYKLFLKPEDISYILY